MHYEIVEGDLLEQEVEVIVNSWNRNIIPWWLLILQGVSGSIKKRAGYKPFKEVAKFKSIPLGEARITSAGKLPYKAIIHVAGIDLLWRASEKSIKKSISNAIDLALEHGYKSIALPVIGAGEGGFPEEKAITFIKETIDLKDNDSIIVKIVKYKKSNS